MYTYNIIYYNIQYESYNTGTYNHRFIYNGLVIFEYLVKMYFVVLILQLCCVIMAQEIADLLGSKILRH